MNNSATALVQGLVRCHDCGMLAKLSKQSGYCDVCGSRLHARIPHSLQRSTAFLLSGYALYIPANIFPIMTVTQLARVETHTIIGGIFSLIENDMVPIAPLVL